MMNSQLLYVLMVVNVGKPSPEQYMHIVSVLFPWMWSKNRWCTPTSSHCTEAETTEGRNVAIFCLRHLELEFTQRWLINRARASNFHPYNHLVDHSPAANHDSVFWFDLSPKWGRRDVKVVLGHFLQSLHILVVLKQKWLIIFVT